MSKRRNPLTRREASRAAGISREYVEHAMKLDPRLFDKIYGDPRRLAAMLYGQGAGFHGAIKHFGPKAMRDLPTTTMNPLKRKGGVIFDLDRGSFLPFVYASEKRADIEADNRNRGLGKVRYVAMGRADARDPIERRKWLGSDYGYPAVPNRGKRMKKRSRKNPWDIGTSWTGRKADYVSPVGHYGAAGYSELAMHVGLAGKEIVQYALWTELRGDKPRKRYVTWAHVKRADGTITDGTPSEVLPDAVRHKIGYGSARLTKKTAALLPNRRGRRNPIESMPGGGFTATGKGVDLYRLVALKHAMKLELTTGMKMSRGVNPFSIVKQEFGFKGNKQKIYDQFVAHLERVGPSMAQNPLRRTKFKRHSLSTSIRRDLRRSAALRKPRRVKKNISHFHPVWMVGEAAHKFMSYIDNLRPWRDVTLRDVFTLSGEASHAFAGAVGTVQGRFETLRERVLELFPLLKTTIKDAPLRVVAGSWGLMEEMRADF